MELKNIKKVHFIGICGYIMSATAVMLKEMGYQVTGSDKDCYPPGTDTVERAKISCVWQYSAANLGEPDLVVVGNSIEEKNPEVQAALKKGLEMVSLPELIGQLFADKKRIVVAGTHGKTTTTSMIAWVLANAGLDPSYLIGGVMENTNQGFQLGRGEHFVVEGDEYRTAFFDHRPKLFHYQPEIAILTTCEFDHPDYFLDLQATKKVFQKFLRLVPKDGLLVGGVDDPDVAELLSQVGRPQVGYGLGKQSDYQAREVRLGRSVRFKVYKRDEFFADFSLKLPGEINVQNALAAIAVADHLGIGLAKIQAGLTSFQGVKRRFEIVAQPKGVSVIDDYAHHPTKIKKTLAAARSKYPKNRLYAVFEPHTYSRTKALLADYGRAFDQADEVIVTSLMPAREAGQKPTVTSQEVVRAIKKHQPQVELISPEKAIIKHLLSRVRKGDVVLVMSVGGLNNLARRIADAI